MNSRPPRGSTRKKASRGGTTKTPARSSDLPARDAARRRSTVRGEQRLFQLLSDCGVSAVEFVELVRRNRTGQLSESELRGMSAELRHLVITTTEREERVIAAMDSRRSDTEETPLLPGEMTEVDD